MCLRDLASHGLLLGGLTNTCDMRLTETDGNSVIARVRRVAAHVLCVFVFFMHAFNTKPSRHDGG